MAKVDCQDTHLIGKRHIEHSCWRDRKLGKADISKCALPLHDMTFCKLKS